MPPMRALALSCLTLMMPPMRVLEQAMSLTQAHLCQAMPPMRALAQAMSLSESRRSNSCQWWAIQ